MVASNAFAKTGLMRWDREVTGTVPSGTEISKCIREQESKSVLAAMAVMGAVSEVL